VGGVVAAPCSWLCYAAMKAKTMHSLKIFDDTQRPEESSSGIIHTCDACGRRGRWTTEWSIYGSLIDEEDGYAAKFCGCKKISTVEAKTIVQAKRR